MTELPDDELDKLFRKSSEELDPQFDPEDWNSLSKRLDANDGKVAGGWLKKWWPLALMALLIPIALTIHYTSKSPEPEALPIKREVAGRDLRTGRDVRSGMEKKSNAKEEDKSNVVENNVKDIITDNRVRKTLPRSQSKAGGVYLEPNRSKGEGGDGAFSINNIAKSKSAKSVMANNAVNEDSAEQEISEDQARLLISATALASRTLNWENQPEIPMVTFTPPAVSEAPKPEKAEVDYAKWAVRLGYSPDLSTVGFKNYTKPGTAFSLLVEYGLSSRLYLQAGVVRSVKDYTANAGEYKLPKYVTDINTPYDVDGSCTMFEIPVGLRYNVVRNEQSKWFVGTGVSSYYAQKERYDYNYKDYIHGQKPYWQGKTGWFLLSHINASVGYERTITKKLSLVAEPYIRIPVKGVGYGKVNLTTVGMWISLRYTPAFK
ncbi:porin family protein [Dyadobacter sp. CY347]|uniref:porin family protein n=1 Tax=Dyadobacter sp. CY347 TaxID=2909336 RepID=UPI001F40CCBC|nr:porin family protein [Dyadobacter sp. CY347]MCF2489819.1 porin family protein [Dyadobacter sp. CY347]